MGWVVKIGSMTMSEVPSCRQWKVDQ